MKHTTPFVIALNVSESSTTFSLLAEEQEKRGQVDVTSNGGGAGKRRANAAAHFLLSQNFVYFLGILRSMHSHTHI